MYVIVGGVERDINQVETYAEYLGGKALEDKTAEDIFYGARANKLADKIIQLQMDKAAVRISKGESISIPVIDLPSVSSFSGGSNVEKAKNAELHYANEMSKFVIR
jgi:hypothetical protein